MKPSNKTLLALIFAFTASTALAQIMSPYSKFGYGLLDNNATAAQMQMGGVGYAMSSGRQINVMNPASYAAADTLTFLFDMGVDLTSLKSSETDAGGVKTTDSQFGGGLDYITMQVPIAKRFGASLGLLPYSSVGYSFGSEIRNGLNSRQGQGGINQLYLGFAGRIVKGLSVGFNASYMFGNVINDVTVRTDGGSESLFEQVMQVRDFRFQFGAQYKFNLNTDNAIGLGLTYSPGKALLGKAWVTKYDINNDEAPDTIATARLRHNAELAESWGAGISYEWKKQLFVEADFTYQPWGKVKTLQLKNFEGTRFADRYQASLGASYTLSQRGGYFKRVTYRAGGFYNRDYMMVGSNHVKEYGFGLGFGFPALQSKTIINLGVEYRHRAATDKNLLKENYINIRLGLNFNEIWFFQNKIK
ncbi:MAG: hypothetical protein NC338_02480 [Firmicutes bacterium]|nr:hypothetical protein [Bacillota bacterium]MCM1400700.1 hypothetical protein [Bacteroides sp.]MCM1476394.1 hypothetical protein [Bacteroides sp.]